MADGTDNGADTLAVILHYGRTELTDRIHDQLLVSDPGWAGRVRILDNAAPEAHPRAWKRLDVNLYWAGALDWAASAARAEGFARLWFLNNDIYFASKAPHLAPALARLERIGSLAGRVGVYSPSLESNPYHPQMVRKPDVQWRQVRLIDGVAPLIDLGCLEEIGGLDIGDNPYGYGVDLWLSLRAGRAGWSLVVDQAVSLRHVRHSTARSVPGFMARAAQAEEAYLSARLGPSWREIVEALKAANVEHADLRRP